MYLKNRNGKYISFDSIINILLAVNEFCLKYFINIIFSIFKIKEIGRNYSLKGEKSRSKIYVLIFIMLKELNKQSMYFSVFLTFNTKIIFIRLKIKR